MMRKIILLYLIPLAIVFFSVQSSFAQLKVAEYSRGKTTTGGGALEHYI